jgi:pimeloyl-ACP methyl ester carboxylesterase
MVEGSDRAKSRYVDTGDGRRLRVEVAGDGRRVVLVQAGSPNAGVLYHRWVEDAAARDLTLVTYDRPGYGGSSAQPGRSVADCAADVAAISESLGFERCAVWGLSGGGPHALACGALLGELVAAVATIGSPAPFHTPGFDFFAGTSDGARKDHELFIADRAAWDREAVQQRNEYLAWSVDEFCEQWSSRSSQPDVEALRSDFGVWIYHAAQAALAPGYHGWADDDIAFHSPWGFDLAQINVPVKVWHSRDDRFVPFAHGRLLTAEIKDAEGELSDDDGHLAVVAHKIGAVHEWLGQHL